MESHAIKYGKRVREINRVYEQNNNADLDNGVINEAIEQQELEEAALNEAVRILVDGQPQRARRILDLLSDSTTEIPQSAHGMKGASGAVRGNAGGAS